MVRRTAIHLLAWIASIAAVTASPAVAQGFLVSANFRADALAAGPVRVEIDYVLVVGQQISELPLEGVAFAGSRLTDVAATLDGVPLLVELQSESNGRLSGRIEVPSGSERRLAVRLTYRVSPSSGEVDATRLILPVLALGWPPQEALPGTFRAQVTLPVGLSTFESFPAGLVAGEPLASGGRVHSLELPVVPALIRIRSGQGAIRFNLPLVMDVLVLGLFLMLGVKGWRAMRELS